MVKYYGNFRISIKIILPRQTKNIMKLNKAFDT